MTGPGLAYTTRHSTRAKRITVRVDPHDGGVEVVLPARASERDAANAVVELAPWINRHRAKALAAQAHVSARGDTVPYLGATLELRSEQGRTRVHRRGDELLVPGEAETRAAALERWYRRQAKADLTPRVEATVRELDRTAPGRIRIPYRRTTIGGQRTRWGSCSTTGSVALNWRLMLAPDEVAEYVVVHEVCHLAEMNHSERYWALVERLYPGYGEPRAWLRAHGATLALPGPDTRNP